MRPPYSRAVSRLSSAALLAARVALAAVLAAVLISGCGGGEQEQGEDVTALLDRALSRSIDSADLALDAELEIKGLDGYEAPIRLQAGGPITAGERDGLPTFDVDVDVAAQDAGQSVTGGFLSTGDRAFVEFGGEFYEQPQEDVARANEQLEQLESGRQRGSSLQALGLDPGGWVVDGRLEGSEEIAGVATRHVSARLDVRAMLSDLNGFARRSRDAVGGIAPGAPQPLTSEELDQIAGVAQDPRFDVYVGEQDGLVRRISGNLELVVPQEDRAAVGGIEGGSVAFSIELADVNGDQQIDTPEDARPIAELKRQLGGVGALGSGALGGSTETAPEPDTGAEAPAEPVPGDTEAPDADALEGYADCLDEARPDETAQLTRCAELLR